MKALNRIVILGPSGQVGTAWQALLGARAIPVGQQEADFMQPDALADVLTQYRPDAVVNCAAYTAVDKAESEPETAQLVNGDAPGAIARWCAANDVPLVHYSTDYVFNGQGTTPWVEDMPTGPLSVYGKTKLDGERQVAASGAKAMTFRTSWVYDADGKNFVNTMLRLGAERETLSVVADQHGAPTYAPHLAEATWQALQKAVAMPAFPSGIYHACNAGETTWHGFAEAIFAQARAAGLPVAVKEVNAIPSSAYPTPAARPTNSRMSCEKMAATFGVRLPSWEQGLAACMKLKLKALAA